jgi:hypothetical protein
MLNELDMSPGDGTELPCVVIARTSPGRILGWKLVPLLAGYLASFAADTETGIGEKAHGRLRRRGRLFAQHRLYALCQFQQERMLGTAVRRFKMHRD